MIPIPIFQNVGTNVFSFSLISVRGIFDYYLTNIWFILLVGVLLGIFSYILTSKHIKPDLTIILRILIYLPKMMLLFLKNIYVRFTALSTFFMKNFVNIIRRRQEVFVPIIGKIASGKTTFLAALTQHISYSKYGTAEGDREELRSIYRIIGQSLDIASKKKPPTELGIHPIKFVINAPDKFNRWPKTLIVKTGDISGMDFEKETRVYRKIIQETPLIICLIDLYQKGIKIDKFNDSETIQTRFSKQFAEIAIGIESAMKFNNNLNVLFLYPKSDLHKFNEAVIKERLDISLSTLSARLERKDGNIFAPISFNSFDIIQGKTLDKMDRILANIFYATRMTKRLEKFPDIKFNDLSKENEGKKQRSGLN